MHPRIDQLLSLRDGEPVDAATREHAESCAVCAASLHRLTQRRHELQNLPLFDAPEIDYSLIRARAAKSAPAAANGGYQWSAVAAAIVAAVIAGFMAVGRDHDAPAARVHNPVIAPAVEESQEPALAQLVERSRELDHLLQNMPRRPEVQRVSLAGTVDRLEQRVQWLDMQLSSAPDVAADEALSRRMWRERVDLMDSLLAVRYAESLPRRAFAGEPPG
jgi:hypothetical protein